MRLPNSKTPTQPVFQALVHYSGRVQGVGFRYETLQIAKEFDVSGCVRNLLDGRVRLEAEGESGEVTAFVREVEDRLSMYIRKVDRIESTGESRYQGFIIS